MFEVRGHSIPAGATYQVSQCKRQQSARKTSSSAKVKSKSKQSQPTGVMLDATDTDASEGCIDTCAKTYTMSISTTGDHTSLLTNQLPSPLPMASSPLLITRMTR